jgi:hypothetical protein
MLIHVLTICLGFSQLVICSHGAHTSDDTHSELHLNFQVNVSPRIKLEESIPCMCMYKLNKFSPEF